MQRAFADLFVDMISAVVSQDGAHLVRVSRVLLDLPLEVSLAHAATEVELVADLPRWRWSTTFDRPCSRLRLVCEFGVDG